MRTVFDGRDVRLWALVLAVLLAGCGGGSGPSEPAAGSGPDAPPVGADSDVSEAPAVICDGRAFYLSAHQDDWQLFMNPNAYRNVVGGAYVTFIYVTAGDSGNGAGPDGNAYYKARNEGALRGVRFMADVASPTAVQVRDTVTVANHTIERYAYKRTTSYFLNLPDGKGDGGGFPATGHASLARLHSGAIPALTSVDGAATYVGWTDLVDTLESVLRMEMNGSATDVCLNVLDPDPPGEHSDHVMVGLAARELGERIPELGLRVFQGYPSRDMSENLKGDDLFNEAAVFAVSVSGRADFGHYGSWDRSHKVWLGKNYLRVERPPMVE